MVQVAVYTFSPPHVFTVCARKDFPLQFFSYVTPYWKAILLKVSSSKKENLEIIFIVSRGVFAKQTLLQKYYKGSQY